MNSQLEPRPLGLKRCYARLPPLTKLIIVNLEATSGRRSNEETAKSSEECLSVENGKISLQTSLDMISFPLRTFGSSTYPPLLLLFPTLIGIKIKALQTLLALRGEQSSSLPRSWLLETMKNLIYGSMCMSFIAVHSDSFSCHCNAFANS
jgi:hypothetical protein